MVSVDNRTLLRELQPGMVRQGVVRHVALAGAVIDIGAECDGFLHISQIPIDGSRRVEDALQGNQSIDVWVLSVDAVSRRVLLTLQRPIAVTWDSLAEGQTYNGKVMRIEKFGAFVDIGAERLGLVHISAMGVEQGKAAQEVVSEGDEVKVRVIGVDRARSRIDLGLQSRQTVDVTSGDDGVSVSPMAAALERALKGQEKGGLKTNLKSEDKTELRADQDAILERTLGGRVKK